MKTKLFCCATSLLYLILISPVAKSQLQKIYLNPKTVSREKQSKYIDSLRFIPLEIKQGIPTSASQNLVVTDQYIILIDYFNKTMLMYSKDGRLIKNINYKKAGGGFYPSYEGNNQFVFFGNNKNYTLTPKDQIKIKLDWENPRNRKYFKKYILDLNDPALEIKQDRPDINDILGINHFYDDYYIGGQITTSTLYKDTLDYEMKLYKNNKLVKSFFPYNHVSEPKFLFTEESIGFSSTDTPYIQFMTRPYCDTIYKMVKEDVVPAYQIVLPLENALPASFFAKPFKNKTERDNYKRNNGWMLRQVYNVYETSRFIYFLVGYFANSDSYIYEKQTKLTYKTKNIKADSSQYNLPLMEGYGTTRNGDRFYRPLKVDDLINFFDKNKSVAVPKELEAYLKTKPAGTAPVIVEFKFKN